MIKKIIEGRSMFLSDISTGLSANLSERGYHEPAFMFLLRTEAIGKLALDIGANIGYSTLDFCKNMKKVIAIEPDPRSRKILKKNIKLHKFKDKTKIYKFALSDKIGEKTFYLSKHPNLSAFVPSKHKSTKIKVATRTIDDLKIKPNFIKMDVEGHEVEIIKGGMKTFSRIDKCKILLEVHPQFYTKERDFSITLKELFNIGFTVKYVISAAVECPDLFRDKGYKPFKIIPCAEFKRGIFKNVAFDDVIEFATKSHKQSIPNKDKISNKIVRAIMLEKNINRKVLNAF